MSSTAEPRYLRFTISDRLEHWAQILTFIPLAVTGLVQRYDGNALSRGIIDVLGGIESVRIIHRWFAAILMLAVVYHLGAIGYRRFVLERPRAMGPERRDLTAARQALAYVLGRRATRPEQGRYTFEEKLEYWSLVWGTALMIATGFLLWNPIASATFLPGSFIPAAKAAHGGEALLAVLAIVVWHIYHVHVRHFNTSMFTGYLSADDMRRDHPLELAAGTAARTDPPPAEELRRRRRRYLPLYSSGALVMLAGIWLFISFESTAIETIEPIENPVVFAPVTTSTSQPASTTSTSTTAPATTSTTPPTTGPGTTVAISFGWADFAEPFATQCGSCHGDATSMGGLSLATYAAALAGGDDGPGIVPGDPDAGTIIAVQTAGDHPAQLDEATLADLRSWIQAGAAEEAGAEG